MEEVKQTAALPPLYGQLDALLWIKCLDSVTDGSRIRFYDFESALEIINLLKNARSKGLNPLKYGVSTFEKIDLNLFDTSDNSAVVYLDTLITHYLKLYARDVSFGIGQPLDNFNLDSILIHANNENRLTALLQYEPKHPCYQLLVKGLVDYLSFASLSDSSVTVHSYKSDSAKSYHQAGEALRLHGYLNQSDTNLLEALKKFQRNVGLTDDGKIGVLTAESLSRSSLYYFKSAVLALDKWRRQDAFEAYHIFVNVPGFFLKFIKENNIVNVHTVVVGTPNTQTPEFDSYLEQVVAYPYWNVPYSIASGEILPKVKKDSTYIFRNNYEVLAGNQVIDPSEVNWKTATAGKYQFRQKGGTTNALGLVKFLFPNQYSVYMHDTPSKQYFEKEIRSYSHGCVRVKDPMRMADFILKADGHKIQIDSVKKIIEKKVQKVIVLNKKFPVHIKYMTAEGDDKGIRFLRDIYGKEVHEREKIWERYQKIN